MVLELGTSKSRALVDDREADVAVVQEHVAGRMVADVLDDVVDGEPALADPRLDAATERQVLAEDRRLKHLALGPQDAVVPIPSLAIPGEPSGQPADPSMEPERLRRADVWLVIVLGRVLARPEGVVETAGHDHAAAPCPEPAPRVVLVEPRADRARVGDPRQRRPAHLATSHVERAIDDDVEGEAGAGAELEEADAATGTVAQRHEPDAGDLIEPPDAAKELGPPELTTEQDWHDEPRSSLEGSMR